MKDKFFALGNRRGLRRHQFVHAVFMHLYETIKGLHVKADAARVVAMLDELFDQIGGQGLRCARLLCIGVSNVPGGISCPVSRCNAHRSHAQSNCWGRSSEAQGAARQAVGFARHNRWRGEIDQK